MKLLEFVALYGLILMPMGAIIFADFYFYPKLRLLPEWAIYSKVTFNRAAGWTWLLTLGLCMAMSYFWGWEIYFLGLPGWFVAVLLYVMLGKWMQSNHKMKLA
ncbi:MAG: hypothetical protein GX640_05005 [Fibrobacter sp.]|nr:hypothetical protein [Fibrobacter sp.]